MQAIKYSSDTRITNYAVDKRQYRTGLLAKFSVAVYFVLIRMLAYWGAFDVLEGEWGELAISFFWPILGELILPVIIYYIILNYKRDTGMRQMLGNWGYRKPTSVLITMSILVGILYTIANTGIAVVTQSILINLGVRLSSGGDSEVGGLSYLLVAIFVTAILPSLCEENLTRGMVAHSVKAKGERYAIVMTALIFGLAHMNIAQFGYTFCMGLITGYIVVKTHSILPGIIMHFINNFSNVYLSYAHQKGCFGGEIYTWLDDMLVKNPLLVLLMWAAALACAILVAIVTVRKHNEVMQRRAAQPPAEQETVYAFGDAAAPEDAEPYKPAFADNIFLYGTIIVLAGGTLLSLMIGLL